MEKKTAEQYANEVCPKDEPPIAVAINTTELNDELQKAFEAGRSSLTTPASPTMEWREDAIDKIECLLAYLKAWYHGSPLPSELASVINEADEWLSSPPAPQPVQSVQDAAINRFRIVEKEMFDDTFRDYDAYTEEQDGKREAFIAGAKWQSLQSPTVQEDAENAFVEKLIEELPSHGIDTSKWEYEHGECCDDAVEFLARCIKSVQEDKGKQWVSEKPEFTFDYVARAILFGMAVEQGEIKKQPEKYETLAEQFLAEAKAQDDLIEPFTP